MNEDEATTVPQMLELRPIQFCMFLRALIGPVQMGRIMVEAIKAAKNLGEV